MNLVPNTNSKTFTLSAIIIGYILIDDLTPAEQNSLGNWFMLIGQILSTNSAQQQVINNRTNQSNTSNQHIINSNTNQNSNTNNNEIEIMQKAIRAIQQEIDNLKTKK